ncbi:MAG TPA: DUF6036 family nucleotidyltransferase [Thermoanaerobaculia bacterium]|nr:DUF6036 family nucleotidyltransferase [Thermoanaerobaculia bacterium]
MDDAEDRGYSRAPELEDLVALCKALNDEDARYVLIGGFAVILHGYVRATKDIDLLVDASPENVRRLKRAMATLPDNAIELIEDDEVEQYGVVRIADEYVVDLMKSACGVQYEEAISQTETRTVEGYRFRLPAKSCSFERRTPCDPVTPSTSVSSAD